MNKIITTHSNIILEIRKGLVNNLSTTAVFLKIIITKLDEKQHSNPNY